MELHVFSFWNVWKKVAPYFQSSLRPEIFILVTCDLPPRGYCYVFFMSSYWLLGIFILVLIGRFDKLGFGSWHSIQNLSFQKQLSFTYWPSRSFLWISLTSKDKQARPTVLSHNRKKVKQRDFEICKKQSQTTKKDERWWWEKDDLFQSSSINQASFLPFIMNTWPDQWRQRFVFWKLF